MRGGFGFADRFASVERKTRVSRDRVLGVSVLSQNDPTRSGGGCDAAPGRLCAHLSGFRVTAQQDAKASTPGWVGGQTGGQNS